MPRYTTNPETGRKIQIGGPTWKKLRQQGKLGGKKSPKRSPKKSPKGATKQQIKATTKTLPKTRKAKIATGKKTAKHASEGRGSPTRGWAVAAPQRGKERQDLAKVCVAKRGTTSQCFLGEKLSYPVCRALRASSPRTKCKPDRRGVQEAYNRAKQRKNTTVARRASKLLKGM
jgi:2-cysteine adaptor domain